MSNPTEFAIKVTSDDPKKKDEEKKEKDKEQGSSKDVKKVDGNEEEELSEEDLQLRNELEMLVERLKESNTELYRPALETLRVLIRTSTSSMTSVPKPLKFLRPHYRDLQALYETWPGSEDKSLFADILSVLAMTYSDTEPRGTLRYRLLSASLRPSDSPLADPGTWGHEYVRHIASELGEEFHIREEAPTEAESEGNKTPDSEKPLLDGTMDELRALAKTCAIFLLSHNAEPDAVDLLAEMEIANEIAALVDENTFGRVCQYMLRCVSFLPPPDDISFLKTVHDIYVRFHKFPEALSVAIRLGDKDLVAQDFDAPGNPLMKLQLAYLLGRAQTPIDWVRPSITALEAKEEQEANEEVPAEASATDDEPKEEKKPLSVQLLEILGNVRLSTDFRIFGKELGVLEPKTLEEVYKSHLENTRPGASANVDSARANLAGSFVNAFVNAGFGNEKLMAEAPEGTSWVYKNKDHAMMSATASIGLSCLWDHELGLGQVDKYSYSPEEHIKAGAILANGLLHCGIKTEIDAPLALLCESLDNPAVPLKTSAIMGLAFAYAGSHREDVLALLEPHVSDDVSMEIASLAALALGFVFTGSANGDVADTILQTMMEKVERGDKSLDEKWARFMALGLGLVYLGLQDQSDATLETLKAIDHPISRTAQIMVEACAFAFTGNVLRVQGMIHHCDEHIDVTGKNKDKDEKKETADAENKEDGEKKDDSKEEVKPDDTFQAFAVLGIAMMAMGEDIGAEMSLRQFNHLMHYGEPVIRKAVPLAIGLVSASNPQLPILETLSKYSHDNDLQVAMNAIFAMGLVGAGTNNARLGQMLRQLAGYYYKEPDCLFVVRIAQGLVGMGKGTITINPFFSDRTIMSRPAVAGLLATLTAFTDIKGFILDRYHWMLYFIVPAMYPRFMLTLNEKLEHIPVTVRVGQAVDVVGQAGKPRTISGFQTHQTPVRLGNTERAELATEEFIPFAHVLEGCVILQKNPGWEKEDKMEL